MKLIKKEGNKIILSNYIGAATEKSESSEDIIKIAKEYKESLVEKVENAK